MKLLPLRRYFDFVNFNTSGYRPYLTTLYAVLLGCLRKTISRVLVLIVSMGFGVIVPYLGAVQQKVSCLPFLPLRRLTFSMLDTDHCRSSARLCSHLCMPCTRADFKHLACISSGCGTCQHCTPTTLLLQLASHLR